MDHCTTSCMVCVIPMSYMLHSTFADTPQTDYKRPAHAISWMRQTAAALCFISWLISPLSRSNHFQTLHS
jgi:hypothetical protein